MQPILKNISLTNFRNFKLRTEFELAPITVLTGPNSSGKSSVTKAIILICNSWKNQGFRKLDLTQHDIKLGSFDQIKNSFLKDSQISFSLQIPSAYEWNLESFFDYNITSWYTLKVTFDKNSITYFEIDEKNDLLLKGTFDPKKYYNFANWFIKLKSIIYTDEFQALTTVFPAKIQDDIKKEIELFLSSQVIYGGPDADFYYNNHDKIFENYYLIDSGLKSIGKMVKGSTADESGTFEYDYPVSANPVFETIFSKPLLNSLKGNGLLKMKLRNAFAHLAIANIEKNLFDKFFSNINYISAFRALSEMIYTYREHSKLVPLLLKLKDLVSEVSSHNNQLTIGQTPIFNFLSKWMKEFKIIDQLSQIKCTLIESYGVAISFQKEKQFYLTQMGYGYAQLFPIIVQLAFSEKTIIIIEEPESNLHPSFQSKLADMFFDATELFGIQVIVETHSEYLIRKLQFLTASHESNLKSNDSVIYYFHESNNIPKGEDQIKKINIQDDGSLTDDFGPGFFDEATNWKFELLDLNKSQSN